MMRILRRVPRDRRGFTLIELLIVIAILGILGAVVISAVISNVTGIVGEGETEVAKAELVTMQTAMDIMMAKNSLSTVTATSATSDMSAFPTGNSLYPDYLRMRTAKDTYSSNTTGNITQETTGY